MSIRPFSVTGKFNIHPRYIKPCLKEGRGKTKCSELTLKKVAKGISPPSGRFWSLLQNEKKFERQEKICMSCSKDTVGKENLSMTKQSQDGGSSFNPFPSCSC